jgi:hypothetical protein
MEFIRVTLCQSFESLERGETLANLQTVENYLLPVCGIKSIQETQSEPGVYHIEICDSHLPKDVGFPINNAKAKLPKSFIDVVN